ncbi:MAG: hypothetical protein PHF00_01460 [Elusimicrobia bacterium]|nr:hypothetical protein [Elusimicrobiota bacterium]
MPLEPLLDKQACPTKSVSARELERIVLDRLAFLGKNQALMEKIVRRAKEMTVPELPAKRQQKIRLVAEIGKVEAEVGNVTSILAEQGKDSPLYRALMDKLGQTAAKREELEKQVQALDH